MRYFLQIAKHIQIRKGIFLFFVAGYVLMMTVVVMIAPTNASFTNEATVKGQIAMSDTFEKEKHVEDTDDEDHEDHDKDTDEQDQEKQDTEK